ncbi:hypothetical protein T12_17000 [Trichinella patagoniensis]|uniref:Uncharacterized protein n=1 Tax=Trichinella patagoniensis TaxID=990121 RepID=A0A0V1ACQ3_9BILA|nr:hypothetical protein T12_17000 [Trichinella patagoniensis]
MPRKYSCPSAWLPNNIPLWNIGPLRISVEKRAKGSKIRSTIGKSSRSRKTVSKAMSVVGNLSMIVVYEDNISFLHDFPHFFQLIIF